MRKVVCALLCILLICILPSGVFASEERTYEVDVTVEMQNEYQAATGEIVTVRMYLNRTDTDSDSPMYAMQNELWYDDTFFELVEGSQTTYSGVEFKDMARRTGGRTVYLNFLSLKGGTNWPSKVLVGSFQLKVIGTQGASSIISENLKISSKDGLSIYEIENLAETDASKVTKDAAVILSSGCTVKFDSSGGNEVPSQIVQYGEKVIKPDDPVRGGLYFTGWYTDLDKTDRWNFDKDVVKANMTLYAGWSETPPVLGGEVPPGGIFFVFAAIVLIIAIFAITKKKVNFDTDEGSLIKSVFVRKGSCVKRPADPVKNNYIFDGWYSDRALSKQWDFNNDKVSTNMTLYAKWKVENEQSDD